MDLIIGGAYQGKLQYAAETFKLGEEDIWTCTADAEPDWSRRCIRHLEEYVLFCLREGKEIEPRYRPDAVLIFRDIFCGVVSIDPEERAWREEAGRLLTRLSREAESVTRLFCSLPQRLK